MAPATKINKFVIFSLNINLYVKEQTTTRHLPTMRTMKQVWMIVALPFLGLVIISSMVIGLLGWGNYRYDTNPANLFTKSACTIIDGSVQEFSQFKSPYSSSCLPAMITCYEVIWQVCYYKPVYLFCVFFKEKMFDNSLMLYKVTYDNNQSSGKVFSNGVSSVVATSLMDQYVVGRLL